MPDVDTISNSRVQTARYAVASILLVVAFSLLLVVEGVWQIQDIDEEFTTALIAVVGFITTAYAALLSKEMSDEDGALTILELPLMLIMCLLYLFLMLESVRVAGWTTDHPLSLPIIAIASGFVSSVINALRLRVKE